MSALVQNPASRQKLGGNKVLIKQIQRNTSTGAFEAYSGTNDCLGVAAGAWHEVGSLEESAISRDASGIHSWDITTVEMDLDRKNLLMNIAPFSATAATKKEALDLEDGTVLEDSSTTSEDTTLPYFQVIVRAAPTAAAKEHAFFAVVQVSRAGGWTQKAGSFVKPKYKFTTIDAAGYVTTKPSTGEAWLTNVTAPTLSGVKAHGFWVEGT